MNEQVHAQIALAVLTAAALALGFGAIRGVQWSQVDPSVWRVTETTTSTPNITTLTDDDDDEESAPTEHRGDTASSTLDVALEEPTRRPLPAVRDTPDPDNGAEPAPVIGPAVRVGTTTTPCAFSLSRALIARGVDRREPIGTEGPFISDGRPMFVYLDANNRSDGRQRVHARFVHSDSGFAISGAEEIGVSSRWRTWIELTLPAGRLGAWQVEVMDDERCLLEELSFEVIPPGWD